MTILSDIADYKREEVAELKTQVLRSVDVPIARDFVRALKSGQSNKLSLIAEVKHKSPSSGIIRDPFDPVMIAKAYETGGAKCLSILTDGPSFGGSKDDFMAARAATSLPCLRKDFIVDDWQVFESRAMGADAILVILAMVNDTVAEEIMVSAKRFGIASLVEVHDEKEMARAVKLGAMLIGINNRNLKTFEVDPSTTDRLIKLAPHRATIVIESGIKTPQEAHRLATLGATAMLVGESMLRQDDVMWAARALLA